MVPEGGGGGGGGVYNHVPPIFVTGKSVCAWGGNNHVPPIFVTGKRDVTTMSHQSLLRGRVRGGGGGGDNHVPPIFVTGKRGGGG